HHLHLFSNYFNLSPVDDSNFVSDAPHIGGPITTRVIGGMILSQATNAFKKVYPNLDPHTMHYNFISPGITHIPLEFEVKSFDDANFASIHVTQNKKVVGMAHFRFSNEPDFLDASSIVYQEDGPVKREYKFQELGELGKIFLAMHIRDDYPVETRFIETKNVRRAAQWLRIKPKYHDILKLTDGFLVAMFLCEFSMSLTALESYNRAGIKVINYASLDHAVWMHETATINSTGWFLSVTDCEVLSFGRTLQRSWLFDENRSCIMSLAQEGYIQRAQANKL
ncbi:hypothetical protein PMAYCL1PPCAC_05800, partial [Pristionchus mayeri]